jgi:hypothetical protein
MKTRFVTFHFVAGEPFTFECPPDAAASLAEGVRAVWQGKHQNTPVLHHPDRTQYSINPAHVVMVTIQ